MSYALALSCGLFAILALGGFLYVRKKRVKSSRIDDLDIPAFLRRENAGNNTIGNSDFDPETRIHPWGKTE